MSTYVIAEFLGADSDKISKVEIVKEILGVISKSGLNCVSSSFHQFKPYEASAIY